MKNTSESIGGKAGTSQDRFRRLSQKIRNLFRLEEVEVTFNEKNGHYSYTTRSNAMQQH